MKELLIGMGLGFVVGAVVCGTCKPMQTTIEKGVEKSKEIVEDISDEVKAQTNKMKNANQDND